MPHNNYKLELQNAELDILKLKKALHILRAINHPLRQEIVKLIDKNERMTVTEIHTNFKIEQAVASQHLAILRRAGFVNTKKESKFVYYALSYDFIKHFSKTMNSLFEESLNESESFVSRAF
jgi:DNA-binding transcriptional ArsR family regulator